MNVAVTAAKECSSSFFPPALRLVLVVIICHPSLQSHRPPSPMHCLIVVFVFVIVVVMAVVQTRCRTATKLPQLLVC
jgi:hypothetical protein